MGRGRPNRPLVCADPGEKGAIPRTRGLWRPVILAVREVFIAVPLAGCDWTDGDDHV